MQKEKLRKKLVVVCFVSLFLCLISFFLLKFFLVNSSHSFDSFKTGNEGANQPSISEKTSSKEEQFQNSAETQNQEILQVEEFKIIEDGLYLRATGSVKNIGQKPVEGFVVVLSLLSLLETS